MKIFFGKIEGVVRAVSERPVRPITWALTFMGIIGFRMCIELFVASTALPISEILVEYMHNLFFFALAFLSIWIVLSLILKENPAQLSRVFLWASWMIVLPPIIDMIKTGGFVYWSFYALNDIRGLWGQFITFFGHLPSGIVYFGTKIIYGCAIILSAALVFIRSKKWPKAILGAFLTYSILFFLGTFPSFFAFAYYELKGIKKITSVNEIDIVDLFGAPFRLFGTEFLSIKYTLAYNLDLIFYLMLLTLSIILFFMIDRKKLWAVIKNFRFPQIIYHTGLFLIGLGLGYLVYPKNFYVSPFSPFALLVLISSIWLAWKASVVVNDIYDYQIDEISNPDRPLQKKVFTVSEYASLGSVAFLLSIIGGLAVGLKFAALLFAYQFIAWVYSAPPFRLKRYPGIATLMSSFASLIVLFMGFTLFSGDLNLRGLSLRIVLLLIIALTLSLPIKDLKDIEGDRRYKIWTIPVLLGEERGKLAIAIGLFISFMSSVFFLNELHLFWWAVIFGGVSFLIVTSKKINPHNVFWWILGMVSVYVFIMTVVVFVG